jgi:hypothetical protein
MSNSILFNQEIYRGFQLTTYINEDLNIKQESTISTLNGFPIFGSFSLNFDSIAKAKAKIDNYYITTKF